MQGCNKVGYQSRKKANKALKSCTKHRRGEARIYHCHCGHYHLTSDPISHDPVTGFKNKSKRKPIVRGGMAFDSVDTDYDFA